MKFRAAILLAMLGLPSMALAGRPGTPDEVVTWIDGVSVLSKRPQVCVRFRNTANVNVGFFVEWSRNGQQLTGRDLHGDVLTCGDLRGLAYAATCAAGNFSRPQGAAVRPSNVFKVMCLREFEPETDYCFRFRTFDADGLWSANWSPTSCARTPPAPELPPAPAPPQLTILPAESGRGGVGPAQPVRVLLEWASPAPNQGFDRIGQFLVQKKKTSEPTWFDIDETVIGQHHPDFLKPEAEFEAQIPFPRDPPSDTLRYEFRVCAMNWGGRNCSAARMTPLGLQQQARLDVKLTDSGLANPNARLRTEVMRDPASQVRSALPPVGQSAMQSASDLDALADAGATLAAEDALAMMLREQLAEGDSRRGFDIAMAAARGQTEWGPGKRKILESLNEAGQSGFETAISYLFDLNRHAARARIGASLAAADATLASERSGEADARYRLGFDIATAIFGDPALGAQGNTSAGPGALGIRNSLSAPAQRGFDAAMKWHLSRR